QVDGGEGGRAGTSCAPGADPDLPRGPPGARRAPTGGAGGPRRGRAARGAPLRRHGAAQAAGPAGRVRQARRAAPPARGPGGCSIFFRCALTRDEAAGFRLEWAGNVFRGAASRGPGGAVLILRPAPVKAGGSDPRLLTDFLRRGGPAR